MAVELARSRNHRRNKCGTCESITQAHYHLTSEPLDLKSKLMKFKEMKILCEEINGLLVFIFKDESLLAFAPEKGFYKVDNFLRKSTRRIL